LEAECLIADPAAAEKLAALRRFNFLRWAAPIHTGGPEAAVRVAGPLLNELFRACDAAWESRGAVPPAPGVTQVPLPLQLYVSQAETLVVLLAALGFAGASKTDPRWLKLMWPSFGASLQLELVEADGGTPFLRFLEDGEVIVPGLGRDIVPYDLVRERFAPFSEGL